MSTEQDKVVVRELMDAFNARKFDELIGTILSPGLVYEHNGQVADAQRWIQDSRECVTSFPDAQLIIVDQYSLGDKVITDFRFEGTNAGPLGEIPPTGKVFSIRIKSTSRVVQGLIVEEKEEVDEVALMRQLGLDVVPSA